jgi:excisionase family DNA binding protein
MITMSILRSALIARFVGANERRRMPEKLYTVKEVAEIFSKTPRTIYEWIRSGELQASKLGRSYFVAESDINKTLHIRNNDEKEFALSLKQIKGLF